MICRMVIAPFFGRLSGPFAVGGGKVLSGGKTALERDGAYRLSRYLPEQRLGVLETALIEIAERREVGEQLDVMRKASGAQAAAFRHAFNAPWLATVGCEITQKNLNATLGGGERFLQ